MDRYYFVIFLLTGQTLDSVGQHCNKNNVKAFISGLFTGRHSISYNSIQFQRMKFLLTAICTILISIAICRAQTNSKLNAVSFELGKTGFIYNLAFDHKAATKNFGFRLTVGSNFAKYLNAMLVGGGSYYLVGKTNHFLELGMDLQYLLVDEVSDDQKSFSFVYPDYSINTFYPSLNLGYRVYSKSTLFRAGVSPGLIDGDFVPGGYVSFGLRF